MTLARPLFPLAVAAAGFATLYLQAERLSTLAFIALVIGCVYAAGVGLYEVQRRIRWDNVQLYRERQEAEAITPATKLMGMITHLDAAAQVEYVARWGTSGFRFEGVLSSVGPSYVLLIGGHRIPREWVLEFMRMSSAQQLHPIREYSGKNREWAIAFTDTMIKLGYAESIANFRAARWVDDGYERAALALFGDEESEEE